MNQDKLPWLSESELIDLTGKKRPSAQRRKLVEMGIDFRPKTGNRVIVYRSEFDAVTDNSDKKKYQPNLDAI